MFDTCCYCCCCCCCCGVCVLLRRLTSRLAAGGAQPDVIVALFVGIGVSAIAGGTLGVDWRGDDGPTPKAPAPAAARPPVLLAVPRVALAVAFLAVLVRTQWTARMAGRFPGEGAAGAAVTAGARDDSRAVESWSRAVLAAVPEGGILLSFTDMNWNGVRYLQVREGVMRADNTHSAMTRLEGVLQACENLRPDVTHLSLQLMPYPWCGLACRLPLLVSW